MLIFIVLLYNICTSEYWALPRTPLGELTTLPQTSKGKGGEGRWNSPLTQIQGSAPDPVRAYTTRHWSRVPNTMFTLYSPLYIRLCPRPHWGSLQRSLDPVAVFWGLLLKRRRGGERRGGEQEGAEERGRRKKKSRRLCRAL